MALSDDLEEHGDRLDHHRRHHADLAMGTLFVEPAAAGRHGPLDVLALLPRPIVIDQLGLVNTVDALVDTVSHESPLLPRDAPMPASISRRE